MDTIQYPYFLTLTINPSLNKLSNADQHFFADKEVQRVIHLVDTQFAVSELTKDGNIHYHILFNSGFAFDSIKSQIRKVTRACPHLGYITKLVKVYDKKGLLDYMTKAITKVYVDINGYVHDNGDGSYTLLFLSEDTFYGK